MRVDKVGHDLVRVTLQERYTLDLSWAAAERVAGVLHILLDPTRRRVAGSDGPVAVDWAGRVMLTVYEGRHQHGLYLDLASVQHLAMLLLQALPRPENELPRQRVRDRLFALVRRLLPLRHVVASAAEKAQSAANTRLPWQQVTQLWNKHMRKPIGPVQLGPGDTLAGEPMGREPSTEVLLVRGRSASPGDSEVRERPGDAVQSPTPPVTPTLRSRQ